MTQDDNPALRHSPANAHSSAEPGDLADELKPLDRQIGWLVVNRWTYRLMRFLGSLNRPEFDTSDITITDSEEFGTGTVLVTPNTRSGAGALLLIHGGGYVIGSPQDILPKAAFFARKLGVPVVCPGYRLSPEAHFPAALDDCHTAWQRLLNKADQLGVDPSKIVVGGYSAGGGLAATLVQRLQDEAGTQPAAQLLIYPMLDDRTSKRREIDKPRHRVWSNRNNLFGWDSYLGPSTVRDTTPYCAAARRDELAGSPPTWMGVGNCDLFLDEDRAYANRLINDGVDATYLEVDGAIHGFDMGVGALAEAFVGSQLSFLKRFTL
ncbi:alpha/beta hydrolase fold domain-containing protein [Erythrobacter sp. Alg231-14]|uniref:alpha/beta hydrolase fold domain-containing protein n=1 Tax=Erythrobacter sp. Alg231-14 TaxID=1922225 RepID=UPI000D560B4C